MAALLGMLTGIGGSMTRDVLVMQIPTVLRADLYAVAALVGAATVAVGYVLHLPPAPIMLAGAAACFALRLMAMLRGWYLPIARSAQRRALARAVTSEKEKLGGPDVSGESVG
jgi:uncharacterized membrane protein YeiH